MSNKQENKQEVLKKLLKNYNLSTQQIAVITALLLNVLEVQSVLVDNEQTVEIVLSGSLKRKTRMDEMLDEMSDMPVKDLWDALNKW